MSVSGTSPASSAVPLPQAASSATTKAVDGDYKVRNAHTSQVKDADGDYAPLKSGGSPAATSSTGVQAALTLLKQGG